MLSAVETHLGPGRPFFAAGPSYPQLLPPVPQVQIPTPLPTAAAMSAAEFVRPHPKTRYNGAPVRTNGLSSPRAKYPEQNGPVNLVCPSSSPSSTSPSNSMSPKEERMDSQQLSPKDSPLAEQFSRLPYPTSPAAVLSNAAASMYALNYSWYRNCQPMYPPPPHPLASRSLPRPPPSYLPTQMDAYPPPPPPPSFISSVPYTPAPQPGITAQQIQPMQQQQQSQQQQQQQPSVPHQNGKDRQMFKEKPKDKNNTSPGFKVPSGKEGSMKHRILTRPYDKEGKQRSPTSGSNGSSISLARSINNNNNNINNNNNHIGLQNFKKGSIIELANGEFKRVEEMRTEDFLLSAENSSELERADSTVVKLTPSTTNNQIVFITFSYDNNRAKVDIDVTFEHPFFVYGKGWSSCNPDATMQHYGLKCQLLQVGDICISLKKRETKKFEHRPYEQLQQQHQQQQHHQQQQQQHQQQPPPFQHMDYPQNLSRRSPATIPTTATATAVSSRPAPSVCDVIGAPFPGSYTNHLLEMQRSFHIPQIIEPAPTNLGRRPLSHENPASLQERYSAAISGSYGSGGGGDQHNQPIPMLVNKHLSNMAAEEAESEASRRRRWSAPDNFADDDVEEHQRALMHGKYSH